MKTSLIHNRRGSGMVVGFFVLTLLSIFGISLVCFTTSSLMMSKRDITRTRALSCAEAGIDLASHYLLVEGPNGEAAGTWRTTHPSSNPNNHDGDTWYVSTIADGEKCKLCVKDGTGITSGKIVVTSVGTATRGSITVTRTIKAVLDFRKDNVNIWNNAIFANTGQAGRSINGNVVIRGSVHLLGDGETYTDLDGDGHWDDNEPYLDENGNGQYDLGEPYTDTDGDGHRDAQEPYVDVNGNGTRDDALTTTDMATEVSGTANIGNNYNDMPLNLRSKLPALETTVYGGETVESLDAKLRVKHGKVCISGSATVGDPNIASNAAKETLDGVFVNDGYGGNKGSASVYSDNGTANGYDLADDLVAFPVINNGNYTSDSVTYANYLAYLQTNATVYSGNLAINKGTPLTITGPKGTLTIDANGNMTISGIVYITGNISFGPSKSQIYYQGSGTLVTPHSVFAHCNILPKTRFPDTDALGVIAGDRVELATGPGDAQLTMALAMYAQHKIISQKQNQIAGTMVSSYFQMSNVPSLYQVPELANHLPPGMPGKDPIWIVGISVESWQEI